ncbi:MAG: Ppx/GppA family phosphatase [Candidatus Kapaibacterium sp.]
MIDLGTNTVLMVVGRVEPNGELTILGDYHRVGRLGKGVDSSGLILPETFQRIGSILQQYHKIGREEHRAEQIVGFGTSALRDASNRSQFIAAMKEESGVDLHLLSGDDEARLTWSGALFGLPIDAREIAVIDIGGGSTEIASGRDRTFSEGVSIDTGAVRVTERFFRGELPPSPLSITEARDYCRALFAESISLPIGTEVVGVAGTVTTLGAIYNGVEQFDAEAINSTKLPRHWIDKMTVEFLGLSIEELQQIPQVASGREDIISGGALVLSTFMEVFGLEEITVSTRGLRYGLLEESFAKQRPLTS